MRFSEKMTLLEEIVHKLETEKLPLEDSLELFERGVSLVSEAKGFLSEAEQRISMVTDKGQEPVVLEGATEDGGR
ncbi:MAG: exodeoxyribonuclease VII small subunit [Synergistota bacterium]|jgi:exodeoxyribonuclease VII small subunit|nr:exodeoxyribonuclease VII small subunit [Synergistota bacterium]